MYSVFILLISVAHCLLLRMRIGSLVKVMCRPTRAGRTKSSGSAVMEYIELDLHVTVKQFFGHHSLQNKCDFMVI